ncbi:DUF6682 family protein [Agarilytica rhodophyticola]|uniref:phage adaptor protein n=1 Tax=Agarilytica rhodophyticola TaxID=1737490 RepID=UPI000B343D37|nr:DUF6682 family protein [Agarilytica rhodophyticola]
MSTVKVIDIISRARTLLYDQHKLSWSDSELLDWYNSALLAISGARPDITVKSVIHLCNGKTKQSLPNDGQRFIDVERNTEGSVTRFIMKDNLDDQFPDWMSEKGEEVEKFTFDERFPRWFYLYPTPPEGHQIDIIYSASPEQAKIVDFETDATLIPIEDAYQDAIFDYIMYRALSKNAEFADSAQRAQLHFNAYVSAIGAKTQSDAATSPANESVN